VAVAVVMVVVVAAVAVVVVAAVWCVHWGFIYFGVWGLGGCLTNGWRGKGL